MSDDLSASIAEEIHTIASTLLENDTRPLTQDQHLFINTIHQQAERFRQLLEKYEPQLAEMRTSDVYHPVGHDLLTPLVSVIGYAEILKAGVGGELPEEDLDYVSQILKKGYRLRDMMEDLIRDAKIKAGLLKDSTPSDWDIT